MRFLWRIDEVFNSTNHETQDLDIQIENRSKRQGQYMTLLVLLTIIFALFSMGFGSSKSLNFWKIIRIVLGLDEPTDIQRSILLNIRL